MKHYTFAIAALVACASATKIRQDMADDDAEAMLEIMSLRQSMMTPGDDVDELVVVHARRATPFGSLMSSLYGLYMSFCAVSPQ